MKKLILGTAMGVMLAIGFEARAQTSVVTNANGSITITTTNAQGNVTVVTSAAPSAFNAALTEMGQAISSGTNWDALAGYGHSLSGSGRSLAFIAVAYNFNENVGVVAGYDYLWAKGKGQANAVKGGVTLSLPMRPLAFIGSTFLTNIIGTPFVGDLLASPKGNNAIGNIVTTGINFDVYKISNFELCVGVQYEKRIGQANWDGNYGIIHFALSRRI
jgi:hypothetical protein